MVADQKRRCPSCGGGDIRHSIRNGVIDALMELFHRRPYRCRNCRRRFYGDPDPPADEPRGVDDASPDIPTGEA